MQRLALIIASSLLISQPVWAVGPAVTQGTCVLTWDAPQTNADGSPLTDLAKYRVYVGTAPGVKKGPSPTAEVLAPDADPVAGATGSWTCTGLTSGQKYAVVTAVDQAGNESAESNEVPFVLDALAPGTPGNLRVGL